jgi:hypothetical protein
VAETPEDVYRAAAEGLYADVGHNGVEVESMAQAFAFRAAVDAAYAAGLQAGRALLVIEDEPIEPFLDEHDRAVVDSFGEGGPDGQ